MKNFFKKFVSLDLFGFGGFQGFQFYVLGITYYYDHEKDKREYVSPHLKGVSYWYIICVKLIPRNRSLVVNFLGLWIYLTPKFKNISYLHLWSKDL